MNLDELIAKLLEFKEAARSHVDIPVMLRESPGAEVWEVRDGQYVENYPPIGGQHPRHVTLILGLHLMPRNF